MVLMLRAHYLCRSFLAAFTAPLCRVVPILRVSPRIQQHWSHRLCRVSVSSTAACAAPGPNRWYNPASRHGSQLHSGSDGAAGLARARLLPDVGIAWLALSQRLRAADDSGHQNSHVPTSYSVCTAALGSWARCCHRSEVRLRRMWLAC